MNERFGSGYIWLLLTSELYLPFYLLPPGALSCLLEDGGGSYSWPSWSRVCCWVGAFALYCRCFSESWILIEYLHLPPRLAIPVHLVIERAAGSLLLFCPRPFLTNRKGEVVGFRLTQVSSPALPCAAVCPWTSGCTSLGKMGNQTPASWGCCAD